MTSVTATRRRSESASSRQTLHRATSPARKSRNARLAAEIRVTRADIALGERDSPERCPIALAFGRYGYVAGVGDRAIWLASGSAIPLSAELVAWVQAYDRGERVEPIAIEVRR